jgi:hypothetical protein
VLSGVLGVEGDASFDSVVAEAPSGAGGKQRLVGVVSAFPEPGAQDRGGGRGERHASLLVSFTGAADVGGCGELDVAAGQPGELGEPQACLRGQGEQRTVAASFPAAGVGGG